MVVIPLSLAVTAFFVTQLLGRRSLLDGVLGALLVVYIELIALGMLLSIGAHLTPMLASVAVALVALSWFGAWTAAGRPWSPWRPSGGRLVALVRGDRLLVALALLVLLALAYLLALSLFTPHAEGDSLAYHLARAAFWLQQDGIRAVPGNTDPRIDGSPPGAEIAVAFTMLATGGTQFAGLVQFLALLGATVASFGLARRLGFEERTAAFGALLFPLTSVVLMQAPTALNDLVVAWLSVSATYFLVGSSSRDRVLGVLAVGCLPLTKVTGAVAIPGVLLVVLAVRGIRHAAISTIMVAVAVIPAVCWLVAGPHTHSTTSVAGVHSSYVGLGGDAIAKTVARASRLAIENLELPGGRGRDALVYVVAGVVMLILVALRAPRRWLMVAAVGVAATALLAPASELALRAYRRTWAELGRTDLASIDVGRHVGVTESTFSWYGPVAVVLVLTATALLLTQRDRRRLAVVAGSPLIWLVAYGSLTHLGTTTGRFLMGSVAISSSTWGIALARRPLAAWAVPAAAVGALLTIVHFGERPLGIRLLDDSTQQSAWRHPYVEGVGVPPGLPAAARFVEQHVRANGRIALGPDIMPTQFFGPRLSRTVVPVRDLDGAGGSRADWVLLRPDDAPACAPGWRRVGGFSEYVVAFRRAPGSSCGAKRSQGE